MSTLITQEDLESRCKAEGIKEKPSVVAPRWAESGPKTAKAKSALMCGDLIIRSDHTYVLLDGMMGEDSKKLLRDFHRMGTRQKTWDEFVRDFQKLPEESYR